MSAPASGESPAGGTARTQDFPVEAAKAVRLVIFDVDGVLTDAGVYLGEGERGEALELKRFDIQDGLGMRLLRSAGVETALVSGRVSKATTLRAMELEIEECHQVAGARKLPLVRDLLDRLDLDWTQVAMLADDLPDLPVLRQVGLPVAVANAVPEIMREVAWVTRRSGGKGAVREFANALLEARGQWEEAVEAYVAARTDE